jgi:hypothetical protein
LQNELEESSVCRPIEGDTFVLSLWKIGLPEEESAATIRYIVYPRTLGDFKGRRMTWQGLVLDKAETTSGPYRYEGTVVAVIDPGRQYVIRRIGNCQSRIPQDPQSQAVQMFL